MALLALNRRRAPIKAQITRLEKYLADFAPTEGNKIELEVKSKSLIKVQSDVNELRTQYYQETLEAADLAQIDEELEELDTRIEELEVRFAQFLSSFNTSENIENKGLITEGNCNQLTNIGLPKIPLPQFSGSYDEWNTFKSQFCNLVVNNVQLSDIQKLCYLRAALFGEAKQLETADDTFQSLLKALEDRFENKRIIVDTHIQSILDFENINNESSKNLRSLVDNLNRNLRALKILEYKRDKLSDILLINIILQKLDRETRKQFELTLNSTEVPDFENFITFLEKRSQILESLGRNGRINRKLPPYQINKTKSLILKSNGTRACAFCKGQHVISKCSEFLSMDPRKRYVTVKKLNLCLNCLHNSHIHKVSECRSKFRCSVCEKMHNSLLHITNTSDSSSAPAEAKPSTCYGADSSPPQTSECNNKEQMTSLSMNHSVTNINPFCTTSKTVLLSTAIVYVLNSEGNLIRGRALLDNGSQCNLLTREFADLLGLKRERIYAPISGLNGTVMTLKSKIHTNISNSNSTFSYDLDLLIVPKITEMTPAKFINIKEIRVPSHIHLADPDFDKPAKIDLLIGAELFYEILRAGKFRTPGHLLFQETVFGYIASGTINGNQERNYCGFLTQLDNIDQTIREFWEIENVKETNNVCSPEGEYCETHFKKTHSRDSNGRYVVQMPLRDDINLGESKPLAQRRLDQLWKRLTREPDMQLLYQSFMEEYDNLQHMEETAEEPVSAFYYLPHHGVFKPEKSTTKLRVVFNASAPSSSGHSLNDMLLKGELPQEDIFSLMLRFRKHKYAFTADIEKMYRQILIHPSQRDLQRIIWRHNMEGAIKIYKLNTITYGTASAPYLATRTLCQLAQDEGNNFPLAAEVTRTDFYMDDILSGHSNLNEAKILQLQLMHMLRRGGMKLHKWCSNHPELLRNIPSGAQEYEFHPESENKSVKALGVLWKPKIDCFTYKVSVHIQDTYTKRDVLSHIARIFDPLGLIGPVIAKAKIFMQQLWLLKIDWHEHLPELVSRKWHSFMSTLPIIEELNVPRYINGEGRIIIHGFSDASSLAYGAAVYVQIISVDSSISTRLLCSKSRVAPIRTVSIPRLELCACVLLSQLVDRTIKSLRMEIEHGFLWTDSTIALAWIRKPPHELKTFVSNRVATIQRLTENYHWGHVKSEHNPADIISRGLDAQNILQNNLWWNGPDFLQCEVIATEMDSGTTNDNEYLRELKPLPDTTLTLTNDNSFLDYILNITNNYLKLIHVLSFIFRFITNLRTTSNKIKGPLTSQELKGAEGCICRLVQRGEYSSEIAAIRRGQPMSSNSKLRFLNPFIDKDDLLRVGGRLGQSDLPHDAKFPIILPSKHKLSKLIMNYFHIKNLHVGPQTLLNCVRQKFWISNGRNLARSVVHECVTCFKSKPITVDQIMGVLPPERVTPGSPFNTCGIDFCGPFLIKFKGQRKGIFQKAYVAIFVCFVTKAIHLEVVSDLSSEALIATLKRFFSRRGTSSKIFTDNAKNFVGAKSELTRLHNLVRNPDNNMAGYFSSEGIEWKFIPPRAPNFGGLWEAGVKSFKHHLRRTVGNSKVTLEEFLTVVTQIEGILNSRPLMPMSSDANDFSALTPGHFLIGRPINALAEPEIITQADNRLSRWKQTTKLVQLIWKRWQRDYLSHLQQRSKWQFQKSNVKTGTLVLLKEDNLPSCKWLLGRIKEIIPGPDRRVRVVTVSTQNGTFKRCISKICILPIYDNKN